jgi:hypothetical protein
MTMIRPYNVKCIICGRNSLQMVLVSSNTMGGYSDLDGRPPPMLGDTINFWNQACHYCKYCASEISKVQKELKGIKEIISTNAYQSQFSNPAFPDQANIALCNSILFEKNALPDSAAELSLHAAWICDSNGEVDAARKCRERAIMLLLRWQEKQKNAKEKKLNPLLIIDLYRRVGRFEEAQKLCYDALKTKNKHLKKILEYEKKLISDKDTARHNAGEAFHE